MNKTEMLLWDAWGMQVDHGPGPIPDEDAAVLDEICGGLAHLDAEVRLCFLGVGHQAMRLSAEQAGMGADLHLDRVAAELLGVEVPKAAASAPGRRPA